MREMNCEDILNLPLTRREFLRLSGLGAVSATGIAGAASILMDINNYASYSSTARQNPTSFIQNRSSQKAGNKSSHLPDAPTGPPAPKGGLRLLLADDFLQIDPNLWSLGPEADMGATPQTNVGPYNDVNSNYEAALLDTRNLSVSASNLVMKLSQIAPTEDSRGVTHDYMGCAINSTGSGNSTGFRFSPAFAGTLYFEARYITTGNPNLSGNKNTQGPTSCAYPGFWASSVRTWGANADDNRWTREMDFQEWAGGPQHGVDSNNLVQPNGYGSSGLLAGNGNQWGSGQPNVPCANAEGVFDPSEDFHTYTVAVYGSGAFDVWMDGHFFRSSPINNLSTYGRPTVNQYGNNTTYESFSTAYDWMSLIVQCDMCRPPGDGWDGDEMLLDYIMAWQDASVPKGQGVQGGGIAKGTLL